MDEVSEKIDKIIKSYVEDIRRYVKVDKAFLYGSYAKGNYTEYSDLDIAIFSESFNSNSIDSLSLLFSIARKYKDICIEPIGFTTSDINEGNPFVMKIVSTGKEIMMN